MGSKFEKPVKYSFNATSEQFKTTSGIICNVSISKEKFYNGKIESVCTVYTTSNNVKFFFPENLNTQKQSMTPDLAVNIWESLPLKLQNKSQKRIAFLDVYNPDDSYWQKLYKNFGHSYATGGAEIIFYRFEAPHSESYVKHTYCHEIAHFIDDQQGYSESQIWKQATQKDFKIS